MRASGSLLDEGRYESFTFRCQSKSLVLASWIGAVTHVADSVDIDAHATIAVAAYPALMRAASRLAAGALEFLVGVHSCKRSRLLLAFLAVADRGAVADLVGELLLLVLLKGDLTAGELVVVLERVVVEELRVLLRVRRAVGGLSFSAR